MTSNLKEYFPLIRERKEVLADISGNKTLQFEFNKWTKDKQEKFLDFCTGVRGMKILMDSVFKEVMNPEFAPERLSGFLSQAFKQKVTILKVLPNDSIRLASEGTLLITDVVVELENGSIVNVEVQRIGYMFPGQRAACYSADLLLRQYKRVREANEDGFTYKNIKPVYTIVIFEKSPKEFHKFPSEYLHYVEAKSDTGVEVNLLQKYIFIPLDIFRKTSHNKCIANKMDAWLTFFSTDNPEQIIHLITAYPEFKPMYEDVYQLCLNTEKVMGMFSKELQILDENTVKYMMDEQQAIIDEQKETIKVQQGRIDKQKEMIGVQQGTIDEQKETIDEQKETIDEQKETIDEQKETIDEQKETIDEQKETIIEQKGTIDNLHERLETQESYLKEKDNQIRQLQEQLKKAGV